MFVIVRVSYGGIMEILGGLGIVTICIGMIAVALGGIILIMIEIEYIKNKEWLKECTKNHTE